MEQEPNLEFVPLTIKDSDPHEMDAIGESELAYLSWNRPWQLSLKLSRSSKLIKDFTESPIKQSIYQSTNNSLSRIIPCYKSRG